MNNNWNTDIFLKENNIDFKNITPVELSKLIGELPEEKKKIILKDYRIKEFYKNFFLTEKNSYSIYENIFINIDLYELQDIFYDKSFLKKFFQKNQGTEYILFASAIKYTKNLNKLLDLFLDDENLFYYFKENYKKIYSLLNNIDNIHIKKLIDKIVENNLYMYFPEIRFTKENEAFILNEDYNIDIFMKLIINNISFEKRNDFFQNNPKAELAIPYLDATEINNYINSGIIFGNRIIKNPHFFELLKCDSLITFRQTINNLLYNCDDPHFIENKVKKYYDILINSYQKETGLFKEYEYILENEHLNYKIMDPFLLNVEMDGGKPLTKEYLQKETSLKISELIIEALFNDNIYNVHLNIKELLRYSKYLNEFEKLNISKEFYEVILDIDSFFDEIKINLYNALKETDVKRNFYEDLRKTKNSAYKKINEKLTNPNRHNEYINKEASVKNDTLIYDFREKNFYMLVRVLFDYYDDGLTTKTTGSYSIISSNNTEVFHEEFYDDIVIYGYNNFDIEKVKHMYEIDAFTTDYSENRYENSQYVNRILTAKELVDTPGFNEILIQNQKIENNQYKTMKPDFVIAIDKINDKCINASKKLNIPIVIIKSNRKTIKDTLTKDRYVDTSYMEESRKNKRR